MRPKPLAAKATYASGDGRLTAADRRDLGKWWWAIKCPRKSQVDTYDLD